MWLCQTQQLGFESLNVFFLKQMLLKKIFLCRFTSFFMPIFSQRIEGWLQNTDATQRETNLRKTNKIKIQLRSKW